MDLHKMTYAQAKKFSSFVLPGVMEEPDAESFWYLSASEKEKGVRGMAVIRPEKPMPDLLSIGVASDRCRQGIGSELMDFALRLLEEAGADALRVAYACDMQEWARLDGFLLLNGFVQVEEETYSYSAALGDILKQKLLQSHDESAQACLKFISGISARMLRSFKGDIAKAGLFDPAVFDDCNPEYSVAWVENEKIRGLFLIGVAEDGELHNAWTWIHPRVTNPKILQQMFAYAAQRAAKDFSAETQVNFMCLTPASERLMKYLIPSAEKSLVVREYICPTSQLMAQGGEAEPVQEEEGTAADAETGAAADAEAGESSFGERQADFGGFLLGNEQLCCTRCRHCRKDSVDSCAKYIQKPGTVYYGGICPMLEE